VPRARILLGSRRADYYAWRAAPAFACPRHAAAHRYVAGIYKALQILYSDPGLADGWIRRPNNAFAAKRPCGA